MSVSVVKINNEPNSPLFKELVMDSTSDVSSLPTDVADGSIAYIKDLSHIYICKDGVWGEAGA